MYAVTKMNLDIMLSEISQSLKRTNTVWFHSYEVLRVAKLKKIEWWVPRIEEWEMESYHLTVSVLQDGEGSEAG